MDERKWVKTFLKRLEESLKRIDKNLFVSDATKLPYTSEILSYIENKPAERKEIKYETDILIFEKIDDTVWKPRIIIEVKKFGIISTHDAITYSEKAKTHKQVHPYLRYGILIGEREHYPLPGRLFRHGSNFDFMLSWVSSTPDTFEWKNLIYLIKEEFFTSKILEEIIYNSRSNKRKRYTYLHKPLILK